MKIINKEMIMSNLNKVKKNNDLILVIKDDAYGFGIELIVNLALCCDVKRFAVKSVEEGKRVRNITEDAEILILGKCNLKSINDLITYQLTPTINDYYDYILFRKYQINCHLAIDIGMNRFGMKNGYLAIINDPIITDIYTHLYIDDFSKIEFIENLGKKYNKKVHVGGSRAFGKTNSTLRVGKIIYDNSISFFGKIINIKDLEANETVGYDATFKAFQKSRIGVCNIGYADGLDVLYSGRVFIKSKYYNVVGKVCMDQCFILIDDDVNIDDEVQFIGDYVSQEEFILNNKMTIYDLFLKIK